ncbi:MAG: phenylalanine--tRNA ligase subunit beta [Candidatus Baltobacteraceae bacterium]|jgi:phenylalanyl-tRNA synthetase beta chain
MKLPIAWLRDFLDIEAGSDEIAARLAQLGFPVEGIERRPRLSGVLIGRIDRLEKHPNADRLQICTVDIGTGAPLTIATAATNVAAGHVVPVATIGAELVGLTIAPRKMRGVDSQGMLVSASEIGLVGEWFEDGILQLEANLPVGADFIERYRLNDDVLEVEVTANRVDAMSVLGLARELGASLGLPVREPDTHVTFDPQPHETARVTLESDGCKRFVGQRFSGVRVRPAPFWIRVRLALAGQRPINNLVDISNFVMLETAQPLHFYDFERLAGRHIIVREARPGETIRTLDGKEHALGPRFLVIADEREAQGLAGLMGGAASEVTGATRELLLEAASFRGPRVRRMSVALGFRTDASSRHEKTLPLGLSDIGAARAAYLLQAEGARVFPPFAVGEAVSPVALTLPLARVKALLGIDVGPHAAEAALRGLGFGVQSALRDDRFGETPRLCLLVTPPPWRGDVLIPEDVVEEIARIVGYDRIGAEMPTIGEHAIDSSVYADERRIAHALAALGYREAMTFALQPAAVRERYERAGIALPGPVVEIRNPLSEDQRFMRFALLPGLLALAARFESGAPQLRYFELGHVFTEADELRESAEAAWLLVVPRAEGPSWRDDGFLAFKGESLALVRALAGREAETTAGTLASLHPGKTAQLSLDGKAVATIGAVDPRLAAAYELEGAAYAGFLRLADLPAYRVPRYKAPSRYPPVARDLAVVVAPEVPAREIERAVRSGGDGVIADVQVFDEYRGPQVEGGKKSIALRVVLQRDDATLTDAEADKHVAAILAVLRERYGAKLRG